MIQENTDRQLSELTKTIYKQNEKITIDTDILKKRNETEILDMEYTMNKKKWIESFSSSLGQPEERVCKLLGISLDIIQSEEGKKKRNGSPSPKVQGIK